MFLAWHEYQPQNVQSSCVICFEHVLNSSVIYTKKSKGSKAIHHPKIFRANCFVFSSFVYTGCNSMELFVSVLDLRRASCEHPKQLYNCCGNKRFPVFGVAN